MIALRSGSLEIEEALVHKGANLNVQQKEFTGATALILACRNGMRDIANLLIANGADLDLRDNKAKLRSPRHCGSRWTLAFRFLSPLPMCS